MSKARASGDGTSGGGMSGDGASGGGVLRVEHHKWENNWQEWNDNKNVEDCASE